MLLAGQDLKIPPECTVPGSLRNGELLGDAGGTDLKPLGDFAKLIMLLQLMSYMRIRS